MANFKIVMTVPLFDNEGNLNGIEDIVCSVFAKLAASSLTYNVSAISAPSILNVASGELLSSEMSVSILTSWS
jgi:transcriptional regulator of acetoin/glycerol metabolism